MGCRKVSFWVCQQMIVFHVLHMFSVHSGFLQFVDFLVVTALYEDEPSINFHIQKSYASPQNMLNASYTQGGCKA